MENSHLKALSDIYQELKTSTNGLTNSDATSRIQNYGYNCLEAQKKISPWMLLAEQFKNNHLAPSA